MRMMVCVLLISITAVVAQQEASRTKTEDHQREFQELEREWNDAHLRGDTDRLDKLWADELVVTVPEMPVMDKARSLQIWRSGHMKFQRYETSEITSRVFGDAAVVTGRVIRARSMQGKDLQESWRFTKVYIRQDGTWRVVAWHASQAEK